MLEDGTGIFALCLGRNRRGNLVSVYQFSERERALHSECLIAAQGFLIERRTSLLYVLEVLRCPDPNAAKCCAETQAKRGQFVLGLWRYDGMDFTGDKTVA